MPITRRIVSCVTAGAVWLGALGLAAVSTGVATAPPAAALDNGLATTPPMGFNDWNAFGCNVSEQLIKDTADYFVSSGLKAAGYQYVNIDDCWMTHSRDAEGRLVPDPAKFPDGIKGTADYVHSLGLKLGIYEDAGTSTCAGYPGSLGHETTDAQSFADWGVDYLKYDNCNNNSDGTQADYVRRYTAMRDALKATGRPIVYSLCEWGVNQPWNWAGDVGNLWRTTGDISDNWSSLKSIIDANLPLASAAGPGHWNDPDMLEVGNGGMTDTEYRTHFSLWSMMNAPLLIGTDLRKASAATMDILLNKEVIALDQDSLGKQATVLSSSAAGDVIVKQLADGDRAVAFYNPSDQPQHLSTTAKAVGLPTSHTGYQARDLWQHTTSQTAGTLAATVPAHGTTLLRVSKAPNAASAPALLDTGITGLPQYIQPGQSSDITVYASNLGITPALEVRVKLTAPAGWSVRPVGSTSAVALPGGHTLATRWHVEVPAGAATGTATFGGSVTSLDLGGKDTRSTPLIGQSRVVVAPPSGTSYVSDLPWTSSSNGWGPVERDTSNGETAAGDGNPITLKGTVYAKGLGVNAPSTVEYYTGAACTAFDAVVGVDDEKNGKGTVEFEVFADGKEVADSGVLTNADGGKPLHADIAGSQAIQLVVTDGGDGNDSDHGDWANATITCA
ncbi:alpha-galactosidase [Actinacidiphila yanglinensis]|uniref:Alpha-galactosidase n=1 Tax=Actinacidiphila yanglinensis TaxID=310779 RepID=A0A1H5XJR6_9ACTN|nr:NPCBM/NEW2 domain-containing protein [Actinacidiphila yanglinensis]SEG11650.1 alpha-galactosidase [Actinacidiphila yanglinensis]